MQFEWDPEKNDSNESKHGISFLDALPYLTILGILSKTLPNLSMVSLGLKAVGKIGTRFFTVIFINRGDVRRIISVRRSRTNERRKYDQGKKRRQR